MTVRKTQSTVTLHRRFRLRGLEGPLDAGSYKVEIEDLVLEGTTFCAYERVSAFIFLHRTEGRPGLGRKLAISEADLNEAVRREEALKRSAGATQPTAGLRHAVGSEFDRDALARADNEGMNRLDG